jgi:Integral membrane protein DUF6.
MPRSARWSGSHCSSRSRVTSPGFFVLTREKLAVAFAINSAIVYMLTGFAAWFFYGERLSLQQWAGLSLLTFGVLLMAYKP